jgi:hypothetical protein
MFRGGYLLKNGKSHAISRNGWCLSVLVDVLFFFDIAGLIGFTTLPLMCLDLRPLVEKTILFVDTTCWRKMATLLGAYFGNLEFSNCSQPFGFVPKRIKRGMPPKLEYVIWENYDI